MVQSASVLLSLLLAPSAWAQDAEWPAFDAALVDACLAGKTGVAREACIGVSAAGCMAEEGGQTTAGTSYCLGQEYELWDGKLNDAYTALMAQAEATDAEMKTLGSAAPEQVPPLRDMQRNWIGFRDAACDFERSQWGGGTGGGPASVQCALTLTARQTFWLQDYLHEAAE